MKEQKEKSEERVVRILSTDIEGKMGAYAGFAKIKGISWAFANAICNHLKIEKTKKIGALTEEELKKIEDTIKNNKIPSFLYNRKKDFETGEDTHLVGGNLELTKEFDIKRLRKIKSYRGLRHSSKLPTRGQRTKSNFRKNRRKGAGIKKKVKK